MAGSATNETSGVVRLPVVAAPDHIERQTGSTRAGQGPICNLQPGNLAEVREVLTQQRGIVGKNDGCDLQVHGSDADTRAAEPLVFDARSLVEIKEEDVRNLWKCVFEPGISLDLLTDGLARAM